MAFKERSKKPEDRSKRSYHLGLYLVVGFYLMMFFIICALSLFYNQTLPFSLPKFIDPDESWSIFRRRLTEDCYPEAYDPEYNVIGAIVGIIYIFVGLAIVCDEFFVPSLEIMAEQMDMTPDVAGATLMAAGGSAPELFTNVFATFEESDAGFGTIIGSAVFNVLFVIGMCAMFSKERLKLTWWPLARDCSFYTMGLCIVALFIGANSGNKIELWEAIVLFLLYFLYILLMWKNEQLKAWVFSKLKDSNTVRLEEPEPEMDKVRSVRARSTSNARGRCTSMIGSQLSMRGTNFRVPGTFRVGIQHLMLKDNSYCNWVSTKAVLDMAGDVEHTFNQLDTNKNGYLEKNELRKLLKGMDIKFDKEEEEITKVVTELDINEDGKVDLEEFTEWYIGSEQRIKGEINKLFDEYDLNEDGSLSKSEVTSLLNATKKMTLNEIEETVEKLFKDKKADEGVTRNQFFLWYDASDLFEQHVQEAELHKSISNGFAQLLEFPDGRFQQFWWCFTLPFMLLFLLTMKDVRKTGKANYCWFTFIMSIIWIGGFAYFMVGWAIAIGDTIKIPTYIMGMTFLAAGTSIPDLLSSVIVARQGHGDMAVSSSIGSNIFDILVGLPLPWIFFILIKEKTVKILSCELVVSILVLVAMLVAVIIAIKLSHWEMSKYLGYSMFVLYLVFLIQDLVRNFSGDPCSTDCS